MADHTAPPRSSTIRKQPLRVLVVDDDRDSAELVAEFLEANGCTVQMASDGATALQVAKAFVADVAVLDLILPDVTGFELLKLLRAVDALNACRFVAYTADARTTVSEQVQVAGFEAQLTKPINLKELLAAVLGDETTPGGAVA